MNRIPKDKSPDRDLRKKFSKENREKILKNLEFGNP
jgi:hypothetical protein